MFENTLLIMKSDFLPNRKCLLLHLLSKGFQIQGNRKLIFTPEDAGEFYKDLADDKCYMLYVILLSKGTSEAFILTKTNAAEDLLNVLICFFGTSMEMERNVHVSRNVTEARREIAFIFPNYIHEPIEYFDKNKFANMPVLGPLLRETYNIMKRESENQQESWRVQLSDWLLKKNAIFPEISNQCSLNPQIAFQEKYQQTDLTMGMGGKEADEGLSMASVSTILGATSDLMSSSSCVSCGSFRSVEPCPEKAEIAEFEKRLEMRAKKTLEEPLSFKEEPQITCEEHIEWVHIYEDVDVGESFEEELIAKEESQICPESSMGSIIKQVREEVIEEVPIVELSEDRPPAEGEAIMTETKPEEVAKKDEPDEGLIIESAGEPAEGPILESEVDPVAEKEPEQPPEPTEEPEPEVTVEPSAQVEESEAVPPEEEEAPKAE